MGPGLGCFLIGMEGIEYPEGDPYKIEHPTGYNNIGISERDCLERAHNEFPVHHHQTQEDIEIRHKKSKKEAQLPLSIVHLATSPEEERKAESQGGIFLKPHCVLL